MKGNNIPFLEHLILTEKEYQIFNDFLSTRSYLCDCVPTEVDKLIYREIVKENNTKLFIKKLPHLKRWYNHIGSFNKNEQSNFPPALNQQTSQLILLLTKAYTEHKVMCVKFGFCNVLMKIVWICICWTAQLWLPIVFEHAFICHDLLGLWNYFLLFHHDFQIIHRSVAFLVFLAIFYLFIYLCTICFISHEWMHYSCLIRSLVIR